MDDTLIVADRSLRLLEELVDGDRPQIAAALRQLPVTVRVRSSEQARELATQAALATLTNALVRSCMKVALDVAEARASTPLLAPGSLADGLIALGESVYPGSVVAGASGDADFVVSMGDPGQSAARRRLVLGADDHRLSFDAARSRWSPADPIVAVGAAILASGEVVRDALRLLPPRAGWAASALEPVYRASFTVPLFSNGQIDLGRVDVVSAGAITDALLWTIRARGGVSATGRVFDDGRYDLTNLNRYFELDRETARSEAGKASQVSNNAPAGISLDPIARRFVEEDVSGAASTIIVGADDIAVRHIAQHAQPRWLGVGATSHFEVRVTEHEPGGPCAGCAHAHLGYLPDGPIPTIAPVSAWAGFVLAIRLLRWASSGVFDPTRAYSTFYPLTRPGVAEIGSVPWHPACPIDENHRERALGVRDG